MKTLSSIPFRKAALMLLLLCTVHQAKSQIEDFNFFDGGIEDGIALFVPYITPWVNAFGTDLNGGWYNTAKPHKFGGFDITLTASTTFVPDKDRSFDLGDLGFTNLEVVGTQTITPTVAGENENGPDLEYVVQNALDPGQEVTVASFPSPPGSGINFLPAPMIQAGVGLPYGTEIIGRYMPKLKIPSTDVRIGLWGIGLKHSIAQHIKPLNAAPIDISLFGGYTRLNSSVGFFYEPFSYDNLVDYGPEDFQDQAVEIETSGFNISLVASTTFPIINVYGSLGYSKSNTDVKILGNIPIPSYDPAIDAFNPVITDQDIATIPDISIKNISGLRTTIGARLKLAVVTIHVDYTYAKYSVVTGGIGFSFR
jgi:hypothetical protein